MDIATTTDEVTYAVVYVPEGYNANTITLSSASTTFYNPEENVLMAGIVADENPKVRTKIARRMRPGDRIAVLARNNDPAQANLLRFVWQASYLE